MKQEIPQIGTKEFNDLASAYFGGKPKQETLEEAADRHRFGDATKNFIRGAQWQQEKIYSVIDEYVNDVMGGCNLRFEEWFEQFKNK